MPILWNNALATGLRQIDLQHQELIELINALESADAAGDRQAAVEEILPRLRAYIVFHFGTEEVLMPSFDGKHCEHHRREHREFEERLAQLGASASEPPDLRGLIAYLKDWLVAHIMKTDQELARLLQPR